MHQVAYANIDTNACNVHTLKTHMQERFPKKTFSRSEGFPNGIFHPCALWARALARWENCRRAVAVAVGVIWEMPTYAEMQTFSKMGVSEISRNAFFSEIKAPAGAS